MQGTPIQDYGGGLKCVGNNINVELTTTYRTTSPYTEWVQANDGMKLELRVSWNEDLDPSRHRRITRYVNITSIRR
jgi:hypothetical protein